MVVQNTTWETAPSTAPRDLRVVPVDGNEQVAELHWQPPKVLNGYITGIEIYTYHVNQSGN